MIINKEVIERLTPCENRFKNYLKFYEHKSFTIQQFMGLKNITHNDKVWVAFKLISKDKLRFVAADIAEIVLYIYENKYSNDNRPRKAIEAARSDNLTNNAAYYAAAKAAYAAKAAAYDAAKASKAAAYDAAAYDAANAANAAYYAAYVVCDAANAAAYYAANAAAYAVVYDKKLTIFKSIRKILIKYLKQVR